MESTSRAEVAATTRRQESNGEEASLELLNSVFGALRAEYFRNELYALFTRPTYFPELLTSRPCVLVGGRGTGKTTVLKSLSFEGQEHLAPDSAPSEWPLVGLYWRIDTSVVRAFQGPELSDRDWERIFAHYVNLTLTQLILDFLVWPWRDPFTVAAADIDKTVQSLGLESGCDDVRGLISAVDSAILRIETYVNNPEGTGFPSVSILGRPIHFLIDGLRRTSGLANATFAFLIDEYENLSGYQQRVFNTLIKHSGDTAYTFKVGVRETGFREKATTNPDEHLIDPADYALIDITDRFDDRASFSDFARRVCESRLARVGGHIPIEESVDQLLPSLSDEEEAIILGVEARNQETRQALSRGDAPPALMEAFDAMSPLSAYLVAYWAESKDMDAVAVLHEAVADPLRWGNRLNNYQHAMLYTIRRGRVGYRKYYAGWETYVQLASGNIRYLLQLVNEALQLQLREGGTLAAPVSPEVQTQAAAAIGSRVTQQLPGMAANGADVTRLVLSLGRIFGVMAAQPYGHTPEVSQFRLTGGPPDANTTDLLNLAVMNLALRRFASDKMAAISGEIKDYSYQLHPIFSPFFTFSYRSKRRMELRPTDVIALVREPGKAIPAILRRSRREPDELPDQLALFKEFFNDED